MVLADSHRVPQGLVLPQASGDFHLVEIQVVLEEFKVLTPKLAVLHLALSPNRK